MRVFTSCLEAAASLVSVGLAGWFASTALRATTPRFRALSVGAAIACLALGVGAIHRLALAAAHAGWISKSWIGRLLGSWSLAIAVLSLIVSVCGVILARQAWHQLDRDDRIVSALAQRLPDGLEVNGLDLTAREKEVLRLIRTGYLSDTEIAETLYISPATAATHVQNILRKTGLHSRRQLMLVPDSGQ
jgi:DNA-binding CsgD family transcriptional regulator